jgi:tRNA dimethylallyltransferase
MNPPQPAAFPADPSASLLPLLVIVGPTAVGKTDASIQLALRLDGEVVSADSRLFYRGMDIGTAKPTSQEMQGVPHHLIDLADPCCRETGMSLAQFQQAAHQAIAAIHARGRLPLLVGGTGQYVRAVIQGWQAPPVEPDPALRLALESWARQVGPDGLHARLRTLDPAAAEAIDYRNLRRTVRALEVIFTTGRPFSAQRRQAASPYRLLVIGLQRPRPELYARIDRRIQLMLDAGWLDEVRRLLERGCTPDLPSMSAIGYRELAAHLQGRLSLDEAVALVQRQTRLFVRRQANWFKPSDPAIRWFDAGPEAVRHILDHLAPLLQQSPGAAGLE